MRRATQPFFFEGSAHRETGVLIVHGFTGSPAEMRPIGLPLAAAGYTAHGVLLAHHGGLPQALHGCSWTDWVRSARDGLARLRQTCSRVFIAGLSLGGLITLHLAAHEPDLRGIIMMAAPSGIAHPAVRLVRFARRVVPFYSPLARADFASERVRQSLQMQYAGEPLNFNDPRTISRLKREARIPLGAVDELIRFNQRVVSELPLVRAPALFAQGRRDRTVKAESADVLCGRVSSADKRVVWLPNSGHVLPLEPDKDELVAHILRFVREHDSP